MGDEAKLKSITNGWICESGKVVASRYIERMGALITVVEYDYADEPPRYTIIRAFMLAGTPQTSVDVAAGTAANAFSKLLGVIF